MASLGVKGTERPFKHEDEVPAGSPIINDSLWVRQELLYVWRSVVDGHTASNECIKELLCNIISRQAVLLYKTNETLIILILISAQC